MAFIEERLSVLLDYESSFGEKYAVDVTETYGGATYRSMRHPYPQLRYDISFTVRPEDWIIQNLLDIFHRSGGTFGGFRVKHLTDYTTNNWKDAHTFNDQPMSLISGLTYQLVRWYGDPTVATSTRRRLLKPVIATVLVGIRDDFNNPVASDATTWTLDTTGQITFDANNQTAVTDITAAASAVVTVGSSHGYVVDESVHFSGVAGMIEINGLRGTITAIGATTITVDINTTGFTAFALVSPNLALVNTSPQVNETPVAGCEFDIPCRFESDLNGVTFSNFELLGTNVEIVELLTI